LRKVVLFGNARFAETNHFYLNHDSPYEVAAFTVDRAHIQQQELLAVRWFRLRRSLNTIRQKNT